MDSPLTTLCTIYESALNDDINEQTFSNAVRNALEICRDIVPNTRLNLIETPTNNFILVTNVLPTDYNPKHDIDASNLSKSKLEISDALKNLSQTFIPKIQKKKNTYHLKNIKKQIGNNILLSGSYIIYTKEHLQIALSLDKSDFVNDILQYAESPGLLGYTDVTDIECLLWLTFCGPLSFCQSDNCFGYQTSGYKTAFPIILPPYFYEKTSNYGTLINLIELYVYAWYKDYDFSSETHLQPITIYRINNLISELKNKFISQEAALWPLASQICIFCAIYKQNRLCIDYSTSNTKTSIFSPIIIKDCDFIQTTITITHVLPGSKSSFLFPVYDLTRLLSAISLTDNKLNLSF